MSSYLDSFASARSLDASAIGRMRELLGQPLGNPSSAHAEGRLARKVLREARAEVAAALAANPDEVVFTSGVTEGLALAAYGLRQPHRPPLAATSRYEHAAMAPLGEVYRFGYDREGRPEGALPPVGLVGVALVNHETGMLASLPDVCAAANGAPVLVDAAQAAAYARDVWAEPRVSALVLSSHKIGGPTGAGALLVRQGHPFLSLVRGGPQEHELRAGTEAVVLAAGFARALTSYLSAPRDLASLTARFEAALETISGVRIVAKDRVRAPGVTAAYALGVPARAIVEDLDARGVSISSGAACAAHTNEPNGVLLALGLSRERALETFRVSFSGGEDAEGVAAILREVIALRRGER